MIIDFQALLGEEEKKAFPSLTCFTRCTFVPAVPSEPAVNTVPTLPAEPTIPPLYFVPAVPALYGVTAVPALHVVPAVPAHHVVPAVPAVPLEPSVPAPYTGAATATLCSDGIGCSTDFVLIPNRYLH